MVGILNLGIGGAVRISDLQTLLLRINPTIVHFSGHGSEIGKVILEDDHGESVEVPPKALSNLFGLFSERIKCVVLNACFSENQAKAIAQHIEYVIGMNEEISDEAAIRFATSFYHGLGFGRTYEYAFNLGINALEFLDVDEEYIPQLINKDVGVSNNIMGSENLVDVTSSRGVSENGKSILDKIYASDSQRIRVVAGPGTGKSTLMKQYVAKLLIEGVKPEKLLAVTFTRVAADSLIKDLHSLGVSGCEKIRAGTLHSWCFDLLNRERVFERLNRLPRPLNIVEKRKVLKFEGEVLVADLMKSNDGFGGKRNCTRLVHAFEAAWARRKDEEPGWPSDPIETAFQEELTKWLFFHKSLLLGELVTLALKYLRNNPLAVEHQKYSYVIVDEYQDLNRAEQELIDVLSQNNQSFVIGDPDQSIYSFRYANPHGIVTFKNSYPDTLDIQMGVCRRCPPEAVSIANNFIMSNYSDKSVVRLEPDPEKHTGEVNIIQWITLEDELEGLANYVKHLVKVKNVNPGDIIILAPRRLFGYQLMTHLSDRHIPAHSYFFEEMLDSSETKEAMTLLNLLVNEEDRVSLRYWLGGDSPTYNASQYSRLRKYCEENDLSPFIALDKILKQEIELKGISKLIERYKRLLTLKDDLMFERGGALIDKVFPESADWAKDIRELSGYLFDEQSIAKEIFDELMDRIREPKIPEEGEFVRVMSLHKSKGLTSRIVIVAGCMEGIIPSEKDRWSNLNNQEYIMEQRRLFYVAMTRCSQTLILSSSRSVETSIAYQIGAKVLKQSAGEAVMDASSFFHELGPSAPRAQQGDVWLASVLQ